MTDRRAEHEPIRLVAHDPAWAQRFDLERQRLTERFPQIRGLEHVGSTAISGLVAKPIVDLLAGVDTMAVADALFEPILDAGYTTSRAFNDMLPDRRWFMRAHDGRRTHHLHVVVFEGPTWHSHLRFRDRLLADPEVAAEYARLKLALATRHPHDREAYTDGKSEFVASVLKAAC